MILESYQDEVALEQPRVQEAALARIIEIHDDGVTIQLDGEDQPREKHAPVNRSIVFKVDDHVKVTKISGTYIVEYPIGEPITELVADRANYADEAGEANTALQATNANYANSAGTATSADKATTADSADLASNANNLLNNGGSSSGRLGLYWSGSQYQVYVNGGNVRRIDNV